MTFQKGGGLLWLKTLTADAVMERYCCIFVCVLLCSLLYSQGSSVCVQRTGVRMEDGQGGAWTDVGEEEEEDSMRCQVTQR